MRVLLTRGGAEAVQIDAATAKGDCAALRALLNVAKAIGETQ